MATQIPDAEIERLRADAVKLLRDESFVVPSETGALHDRIREIVEVLRDSGASPEYALRYVKELAGEAMRHPPTGRRSFTEDERRAVLDRVVKWCVDTYYGRGTTPRVGGSGLELSP